MANYDEAKKLIAALEKKSGDLASKEAGELKKVQAVDAKSFKSKK